MNEPQMNTRPMPAILQTSSTEEFEQMLCFPTSK